MWQKTRYTTSYFMVYCEKQATLPPVFTHKYRPKIKLAVSQIKIYFCRFVEY